MRVLLLTHRLPYAPNRGDRIRAFHLLRVLAARHDVHLVSYVHDAEEEGQRDGIGPHVSSVATVRLRPWRRRVAGVCALATRTPLTHVLLHDPAMPGVLARTRDRVRPDVVLAYCTGMARHAMEPPLRGLPWLLDMVDVDSAKWHALGAAGGLLAPVYAREARVLRAFEVAAMARAAATTVVSDKERRTLAALAPAAPVHVVANGIDVATFAPAAPPGGSHEAVFCGVFDYPPNEAGAAWLAREVWPQVVRAVPDATLSLVGMNPSASVRALAASHIRVTGAVPDVRPYLWAAAVGLAPLQVARGVQNKVLEALAAGLPCVVTPAVFEGLPEAARPGCVSAADAAGFAAAVVRSFQLPPAARRARAAAADLTDLSWDAQLRPMLALLEGAGDPRLAGAGQPRADKTDDSPSTRRVP